MGAGEAAPPPPPPPLPPPLGEAGRAGKGGVPFNTNTWDPEAVVRNSKRLFRVEVLEDNKSMGLAKLREGIKFCDVWCVCPSGC